MTKKLCADKTYVVELVQMRKVVAVVNAHDAEAAEDYARMIAEKIPNDCWLEDKILIHGAVEVEE